MVVRFEETFKQWFRDNGDTNFHENQYLDYVKFGERVWEHQQKKIEFLMTEMATLKSKYLPRGTVVPSKINKV